MIVILEYFNLIIIESKQCNTTRMLRRKENTIYSQTKWLNDLIEEKKKNAKPKPKPLNIDNLFK